MIEVEPQPRIDTLARSGQTGAIVDATATFTDDWADLDPGAPQRPPGPAGVGHRVAALTPLAPCGRA